MKIIYNKYIPFGNYDSMNIFGYIFAKEERKPLPKYIVNHEAIHTAQMKELLYVPFYILYGVEYIIKLLRYFNADKAYKNISFEKEAYANQYNYSYLDERVRFAEYRK